MQSQENNLFIICWAHMIYREIISEDYQNGFSLNLLSSCNSLICFKKNLQCYCKSSTQFNIILTKLSNITETWKKRYVWHALENSYNSVVHHIIQLPRFLGLVSKLKTSAWKQWRSTAADSTDQSGETVVLQMLLHYGFHYSCPLVMAAEADGDSTGEPHGFYSMYRWHSVRLFLKKMHFITLHSFPSLF